MNIDIDYVYSDNFIIRLFIIDLSIFFFSFLFSLLEIDGIFNKIRSGGCI